MTRFRVPVFGGLVAVALVVTGCQYVPPPGGEDAYCYRVDYNLRGAHGSDMIFFTDVLPVRWGEDLILRDTWLTVNQGGAVRFDSYTEYIVLYDILAESLRITHQPRAFGCLMGGGTHSN